MSAYVAFYQDVSLPGATALSANGHLGASITGSVYIKTSTSVGTERFQVFVRGTDSVGTVTETIGSSAVYDPADTSYHQITATGVIALATTVKIRLEVQLQATGVSASPVTFYIDDAELYESYTVTTNPTGTKGLPFKHEIPEARDTGLNNAMVWQRNSAALEKKRKGKMIFGICATAQKDALLSLWRWGKNLTWTPYNPDFPTTLTIHVYDPDYFPLANNWAKYSFTWSWDEI